MSSWHNDWTSGFCFGIAASWTVVEFLRYRTASHNAASERLITKLAPVENPYLRLGSHTTRALMVAFRFEPKSPKAIYRSVIAHIDFKNLQTKESLRVDNGYWVNQFNCRPNFLASDTKDLVLCTWSKILDGYTSGALDWKRPGHDAWTSFDALELSNGDWEATISLVGQIDDAPALHKETFGPILFNVSKQSGVTWRDV